MGHEIIPILAQQILKSRYVCLCQGSRVFRLDRLTDGSIEKTTFLLIAYQSRGRLFAEEAMHQYG